MAMNCQLEIMVEYS